MSLSAPTLSALQALMTQDTALLAQVQATDDAAQAAATIAQAAARQGIAVSETDLHTHFSQARQAVADQSLSDGQLESVAGGITNDQFAMLMASLMTLGIACAIISIAHAAGDKIGFDKKQC
ncbi:MAG: hypothetical protein FD135_2063 [Comamonadaceae bacterium]|nr:MAG: hypothetical protein FD135_2063 [Comamonadaceae bacterium]